MKKLIISSVLFTTLLLNGCSAECKVSKETYIVSGTIVEIDCLYSTDIVIETNDGIKVSVYEGRYSDFSNGLKIGDKVCFQIEKVDGIGYKIIGFGF